MLAFHSVTCPSESCEKSDLLKLKEDAKEVDGLINPCSKAGKEDFCNKRLGGDKDAPIPSKGDFIPNGDLRICIIKLNIKYHHIVSIYLSCRHAVSFSYEKNFIEGDISQVLMSDAS